MKKVFMLLLVVVISVLAMGCSNDIEKKEIVKQATVAEERLEIGHLSDYKGDVAIVIVGKKDIKAEELNISTENLKIALRRDRIFAVGLSMDNEYEVNFVNLLLLKDFDFKSATQDETEIIADYYDRTAGNTSNSYYWFVK